MKKRFLLLSSVPFLIIACWWAIVFHIYGLLPDLAQIGVVLAIEAIWLTLLFAHFPKCEPLNPTDCKENLDWVSGSYNRIESFQLKMGIIPEVTRALFGKVEMGHISLEKPWVDSTKAEFGPNAEIILRVRRGEDFVHLQVGRDYVVTRDNSSYRLILKDIRKHKNNDIFEVKSRVSRTKDEMRRSLTWQDKGQRIEINNDYRFSISNFNFTTQAELHKNQKLKSVIHEKARGINYLDRIEEVVTTPFEDLDWKDGREPLSAASQVFLRFIFTELPVGKTTLSFEQYEASSQSTPLVEIGKLF
jgi:hypothetical protein